MRGEDGTQHLTAAIEEGYRLFDTAPSYETESELGTAIKNSGLNRNEFFLVTKVRGSDQGRKSVRPALVESLNKLRVDHVDALLIHWPMPRLGLFVETWETMIELRLEGLTTAIGVCNFDRPLLEHLRQQTGISAQINQIETHPYLQQSELIEYMTSESIQPMAWSPLLKRQHSIFEDQTLGSLASARGCSIAQLIIGWHVARGIVPLPKSKNPFHRIENLTAASLGLSRSELASISALDKGIRRGGEPNTHEEF
jgi:2,5-diketo-D-gluconate reductase A